MAFPSLRIYLKVSSALSRTTHQKSTLSRIIQHFDFTSSHGVSFRLRDDSSPRVYNVEIDYSPARLKRFGQGVKQGYRNDSPQQPRPRTRQHMRVYMRLTTFASMTTQSRRWR